jgi:hypothetical protein
MEKQNFNNKNYYCNGICEECEMGKHYGKPERGYDTCDESKIKGLNIIPPYPPRWFSDYKR